MDPDFLEELKNLVAHSRRGDLINNPYLQNILQAYRRQQYTMGNDINDAVERLRMSKPGTYIAQRLPQSVTQDMGPRSNIEAGLGELMARVMAYNMREDPMLRDWYGTPPSSERLG